MSTGVRNTITLILAGVLLVLTGFGIISSDEQIGLQEWSNELLVAVVALIAVVEKGIKLIKGIGKEPEADGPAS